MTPGLSMMTAVVDVKPGVLDLDHLIFDLFLQILIWLYSTWITVI